MWYWWLAGIATWLMSAGCIIDTIVKMKQNKSGPSGPKAGDFWGAVIFHGATAILALWFIKKAIS